MPNGNVSGTVIQRTFVGSDSPSALYAASVPLDEIAAKSFIDSNYDMRRLVAHVLAVPSNILLDDRQYSALIHRLSDRDWPRPWLRYGPGPFWKEWLSAWESRQKELFQEVQSNERPITLFARHSIALMLSGERTGGPYWFGLPFPSDEFSKDLELETDETAFATGVACLNARLQRSQRMADFTENVLQYDLPYGNSPRASSDSLLKLLESGKTMCLAPMAAGGTIGVTQLSQGLYVAAILSVGTGAVMTLILLGSVAVGSLLITRIAQRRGHQTGSK